jgi:hypothetical protein
MEELRRCSEMAQRAGTGEFLCMRGERAICGLGTVQRNKWALGWP